MVGKMQIFGFDKGTAAFLSRKCGPFYGAQHWTAAFLLHASKNVTTGKHAIYILSFIFALMSQYASVFVFLLACVVVEVVVVVVVIIRLVYRVVYRLVYHFVYRFVYRLMYRLVYPLVYRLMYRVVYRLVYRRAGGRS